MIPGIMPTIRKKATPDPGGGYSCTLTAGDLFGIAQGYVIGNAGEINREPIPSHSLIQLTTSTAVSPPQLNLALFGDATLFLADKQLWIDDAIAISLEDIYYDDEQDSTRLNVYETSFVFIVSNQYFIEFK